MKQKTPWWMTLIIIVLMIPAFAFLPPVISQAPGEEIPLALLWLYPAYVIAAGICAWLVYPQRKAIAWILVALLVLSHLGMWWLVSYNS